MGAADPYLSLLEGIELSPFEKEVRDRFAKDAQGKSFLPFADLLRAHHFVDEAIELLTLGLEKFPDFVLARVVLARELYDRGHFAPSWTKLCESPLPLAENVLAQKLAFRLCLILGFETEAQEALKRLRLMQSMEPETKQLADTLAASGFAHARRHLAELLRHRGITLDETSGVPLRAAEPSPAKNRAAYLPPDDEVKEDLVRGISGYHVVPLHEVFRPGEESAPLQQRSSGSVELDSLTLADIYVKQGLYNKALPVYQRLLRQSPGSDLLKQRVAEVTRLSREHEEQGFGDDPVAFERLEVLEVIDRQMGFYSDLLRRLS